MLTAVALVALGCAPWPVSETLERPNVLLIVVDDLRPDLGSFGHSQLVTPAIDRLAASGIRFARAYAQYPACNPSRVSLLTGLRPDTTGILDNEICVKLRQQVHAEQGARIGIDLEAQTVTGPDGTTYSFEIAPVPRRCLLNGLDDVGRTEEHQSDIDTFRDTYREKVPFLADVRAD